MEQIYDRLATLLPSLLAAIALLLAGWLAARLLRALTVRAVALLDSVLSRLAGPAGAGRGRSARAGGAHCAPLFWVGRHRVAPPAAGGMGLPGRNDRRRRRRDKHPTHAPRRLIKAAG
jgi:hypothetical protein